MVVRPFFSWSVLFVFAIALAVFPSATMAQAQGEILPTGMRITPLAPSGTTFQLLNPELPTLPDFRVDMAVTTALSPDGNTLLILTSGFNQNLDANGNVDPKTSNEYVFVFDVSSQAPRQTEVLQIVTNAFDGLAWNPNGNAFYVSGGPDDLIHTFGRVASGAWVEGAEITLNHNGIALGWNGIIPVAAGVAVTQDGKHLLAANYENDSVSVIDLSAGKVVSEFDLRPGIIDPAKSGTPGGTYPYWVAIKGNEKAYISSQRDREIDVLDISSLPTAHLLTRIPLPGQPNKMILNHAGSRLFVVQDNTDSVAIIDTESDTTLQEVGTIAPADTFPNAHGFRGAGPNSLALSPDEQWLYVTNGGTNSVAVIHLGGGQAGDWTGDNAHIVGLIPTAWYPTSVSVSRSGATLYVVNGKSIPGPNPKACIDKAAVQSDFNNYSCANANQYIYQIMRAGFSVIPTPGHAELAQLTRQVAANDHFASKGDDDDEGVDSDGGHRTARDAAMMTFLHNRIHHVLFIVKENKTYDQVLGDLEKGNGDPSLVSLPEVLSPNHHQLARQFVTLDNTYCSGEVSGDGWNWSTATRVTDMEQKTIQLDYTYVTRAPIYDFDGTNRNINVGLPTLAARLAANPETPDDPNILAGTRDVAEHDSEEDGLSKGYIWDAALRANKTVRNYGFEYIDLNRYFLATTDPNYIPPLRNPYAAGVIVSRATKPSLEQHTDPYYRGWDMAIADYWLYKEWEREFDGFASSGTLPNLELIALPHDHFGDTGPGGGAIDGVDTIETQMADNDYALALLVQKVSTSRYKNDTVIFVIEDDAQDGPDHVDAHRTIAYVIGPYVKQGAVVSTRYTTVNMVRTIEDILGMEPMGLNDGLQRPMTDVFTRELKPWSYMPIVPDVLRTTQLPLPPRTSANTLRRTKSVVAFARPSRGGSYWGEKMQGLDFTRSDQADTARFNHILWIGLKGEDVPYPTTRSGLDLRKNRQRLLAAAIEDQMRKKQQAAQASGSPDAIKNQDSNVGAQN
jgi:DNA-binding beta-propeller fold protein YncE